MEKWWRDTYIFENVGAAVSVNNQAFVCPAQNEWQEWKQKRIKPANSAVVTRPGTRKMKTFFFLWLLLADIIKVLWQIAISPDQNFKVIPDNNLIISLEKVKISENYIYPCGIHN